MGGVDEWGEGRWLTVEELGTRTRGCVDDKVTGGGGEGRLALKIDETPPLFNCDLCDGEKKKN